MRLPVAALLTVLLAAGCAPRAEVSPVDPAPLTEAAPSAPARLAPPRAQRMAKPVFIRVCVVEDGKLREVVAEYDPATGDTTVAGRPFAEAYPIDQGYAWGQPWFADNEPFTYRGACFIKYGLPRHYPIDQVRRVGEHHGVGLYVEAADGYDPAIPGSRPDVALIPAYPGCFFQTY